MAVTLRAVDLIQPSGELSNGIFPDADLDDRIDGWLARARSRVNRNALIAAEAQNDAAAAYVYYLAYKYIADQIASSPNSVSVSGGQVSKAWGGDRVQYWRDRADEQFALYEGFIVAETVASSAPTSMSIPTFASW